jgi:hypothetical protein
MPTRLSLVVVALIGTLSLSAGACGGDDDSSSSTTNDSGGAVAPSPANAFGDFRAAVEAQGMTVATLPADKLSGAESGVKITGSKSGTGLLFGSQAKAKKYSTSTSGTAKTAVVGTVVFTADTQADADFFANAYEGG